jgi:hypothetical protein
VLSAIIHKIIKLSKQYLFLLLAGLLAAGSTVALGIYYSPSQLLINRKWLV